MTTITVFIIVYYHLLHQNISSGNVQKQSEKPPTDNLA